MEATTIEVIATILFALGVLHTFCVGYFKRLAHHFREGSVGENVFHLLGEVEAVFLLWALLLVCAMGMQSGWHDAVHHMETLNFTEPIFVFVIMTMASTKPVVDAAGRSMQTIANLLPFSKGIAFTWTALVFGPLLGSFITEPAAMTVTALLLKNRLFDWDVPKTLKYAALGTLFVNVSIGGTLTNYAAPPILMVKEAFDWSSMDVFSMLGWKAVIACAASATILCYWFRQDLSQMNTLQSVFDDEDGDEDAKHEHETTAPLWVTAVHIAFLAFVVLHSHHMVMFMGAFLYFLGFVTVTKEYQSQLELRSALMVAGFLGGLVTLGSLQSWWLQPTLAAMNDLALYFGATGLTAVTDNAALTYLGSRVELTDSMKYALVAGAVTGGGLTVIANAPNPAGNSILEKSFGENGISPGGLFLGALLPTVIAILCFLFLPSL